MFCNSKNDPDETRPNVNICPVCMAHPGTLPVINKKAVEHVIRTGLALGGEIANFTEFDRKNYFYPDIPKGYQISQYKYPIVSGGELNGIKITRVHLEEDTANSKHFDDYSLVDYNRAGVPLMELVTEPVIKSAEEAGNFARELQLVLRYLGVSAADMEKGQMRVEANISVADGNGAQTYAEFTQKIAEGKAKLAGVEPQAAFGGGFARQSGFGIGNQPPVALLRELEHALAVDYNIQDSRKRVLAVNEDSLSQLLGRHGSKPCHTGGTQGIREPKGVGHLRSASLNHTTRPVIIFCPWEITALIR